MSADREAWITGIGLISALGEGAEAHLTALGDPAGKPALDETSFAPYPVHPLVPLDLSRQIPKKSDQRQMETWQRIGVYAAGLALSDARLTGDAERLDQTNIVVAAGNGERDLALDTKVLQAMAHASDAGVALNEALMTGLRPTLYLGELSNLLAGNIQLIHHATGSSRTFKGEEIAGVTAVENAVRRIAGGQGDLFIVGGALNAERDDLLLGYELGANLWSQPYRQVWQRSQAAGGGFVAGSMAAFLVIEARGSAVARGVRPYARIAGIATDRSRRNPGEAEATLQRLFRKLAPAAGPIAVLSGASGVAPVTGDERAFLATLGEAGCPAAVRAYGSRIGHGVEAHFPAGIALAALALKAGCFYPPFDDSGVEQPFEGRPARVLVTGLGHWRGEGLALLERIG